MSEKPKRTYSKPKIVKKKRKSTRNASEFLNKLRVSDESVEHKSIFGSDDSLCDDFWKDSFDRLVENRTPLRDKNVIKKIINASYNRNSSIECSMECAKTPAVSEKKLKPSLNKTIVSTPLHGEDSNNLDLNISPIKVAPRKRKFFNLTNYQRFQLNEKSTTEESVLEKFPFSLKSKTQSRASLNRQLLAKKHSDELRSLGAKKLQLWLNSIDNNDISPVERNVPNCIEFQERDFTRVEKLKPSLNKTIVTPPLDGEDLNISALKVAPSRSKVFKSKNYQRFQLNKENMEESVLENCHISLKSNTQSPANLNRKLTGIHLQEYMQELAETHLCEQNITEDNINEHSLPKTYDNRKKKKSVEHKIKQKQNLPKNSTNYKINNFTHLTSNTSLAAAEISSNVTTADQLIISPAPVNHSLLTSRTCCYSKNDANNVSEEYCKRYLRTSKGSKSTNSTANNSASRRSRSNLNRNKNVNKNSSSESKSRKSKNVSCKPNHSEIENLSNSQASRMFAQSNNSTKSNENRDESAITVDLTNETLLERISTLRHTHHAGKRKLTYDVENNEIVQNNSKVQKISNKKTNKLTPNELERAKKVRVLIKRMKCMSNNSEASSSNEINDVNNSQQISDISSNKKFEKMPYTLERRKTDCIQTNELYTREDLLPLSQLFVRVKKLKNVDSLSDNSTIVKRYPPSKHTTNEICDTITSYKNLKTSSNIQVRSDQSHKVQSSSNDTHNLDSKITSNEIISEVHKTKEQIMNSKRNDERIRNLVREAESAVTIDLANEAPLERISTLRHTHRAGKRKQTYDAENNEIVQNNSKVQKISNKRTNKLTPNKLKRTKKIRVPVKRMKFMSNNSNAITNIINSEASSSYEINDVNNSQQISDISSNNKLEKIPYRLESRKTDCIQTNELHTRKDLLSLRQLFVRVKKLKNVEIETNTTKSINTKKSLSIKTNSGPKLIPQSFTLLQSLTEVDDNNMGHSTSKRSSEVDKQYCSPSKISKTISNTLNKSYIDHENSNTQSKYLTNQRSTENITNNTTINNRILNKPLSSLSSSHKRVTFLEENNSTNISQLQQKSNRSIIMHETLHEDQEYSVGAFKEPIVLPPGKWRKSLANYRKSRSFMLEKTILENTFCKKTNVSLLCGDNDSQINVQNNERSITSYRCSNVNNIVVPQLTTCIVETNRSGNGYQDEHNVGLLLLEPTDDETPSYPTLSLLESTIGRTYQNSLSYSKGVDCESDTSKRGLNLVFNENLSNEPRHPYQHQLSVPLYRQLSIPQQQHQRRRSTVVERRPEISCHSIGDSIISYERSIHSQLLSPRDIVLRRCQQSEPLDFSVVYSETILQHCRKIGEGVYGEVFMNKTVRGDAVVLKIIPIEGSIEVNGESQKKFDKILSEIVIAMELSCLRDDKQFMTCGFVKVEKVCCVQGRYPDHLIDLWELYRDNCGTENDHPEIFPDDQLYIVLELANGGQDLEAFTFQNALQSYSAFVQTALTLAVAEQKFQFEHRDLHWGNILLAPTENKFIVFKLNGKEIKIPSHGVNVTIIDYTLSRMVFDECPVYNDLSDDNELFSATGDYQYDIYRLMKQRLVNQWERFEPYTNILWLHYTIDKMISGARYRCSKTKKHRSAIHDMMQLRDELLDYKSACDYVECLN